MPSAYGASRGLTNDDIDNTEYLFYRYDDQGPSWDYGGPEGAAGGTLAVPVECPADFNNNGIVDAADLGLLLAAWGLGGATDINGNGTTDAADLGMVLAAWGPCVWTRAMLASVVLAAASSVTSAETITVCLDGSCHYSDIQEAINAASDGDVIEIAAGTYFPAATIDTLGKAVTLRGEVGKGNDDVPTTVIDGQDSIRVLICFQGETSATTFESLVITRGNNSFGGGMLVNGSNPTLTNCVFSSNSSSSGGGMYCELCSPKVVNCSFMNNSATSGGGGMRNYNSHPTLIDCSFAGNSAGSFGGGMDNISDSDPVLENCTFSGNTSSHGGGLRNENESNTSLDNCLFMENLADFGGGIANQQSDTVLIGCTFHGNQATSTGGGMDNWGSSPTLEDCVISNNDAAIGGGIYNTSSSSDTSLQDSTVCGNSPDQIFGIWHDEGGNSITEECDSGLPGRLQRRWPGQRR